MRRFLLLPSLFVLGSASLFASMDSGLLSMVPPDATVVSSIDVMQARSSEFGQYLLNKTQSDNHDFADFVQQTGFDPRRDLRSLVFENSGPANGGAQSRFAILARGNFDSGRIMDVAKAKGAAVQTYGGVDLLLPHGDRQATAVAFPDPGVAIMADLVTIHRILANRAVPSTLDPALQQKIDQVSNNDAWFVSLTGGSFLNRHIAGEKNGPPAQAMQALQSVLASSGGVRFGNTVDLTIDATARSPQDATSLADVWEHAANATREGSASRYPGYRFGQYEPCYAGQRSASGDLDSREKHGTACRAWPGGKSSSSSAQVIFR